MSRPWLPILALLVALCAAGCSTTGHLPKGDKLYTGADVKIETKGDVGDQGDIEDQLENVIGPEPNAKLLGLFRLKLWLYNIGLFPNSLGEPPVLLSSVAPGRIAYRMRSLLNNKGFFEAEVNYQVHEDEKTADVEYDVTLPPPYTINSVGVEGPGTPLVNAIREAMVDTRLGKGNHYDLDSLVQERARIDGVLKDRGFFYFSPDYLLFQADSSGRGRTVDLALTVKHDIPDAAKQIYRIGKVTIFSGFVLGADSLGSGSADTVRLPGYTYVDIDRKFDPEVIVRSVFFHEGQPYSRTAHDLTLNKLMNLGVFKFVNIRFARADSSDSPALDVRIYLTPSLMKNIRLELQGVSKSNDLVGPVFNSSYRNKNMMGGAELFTLTLEAGFETPLSSKRSALNSYELGTKAELTLPKFLAPFDLQDVSTRYVPKTRISLGFRLLNRIQYFQMLSLDASFGYIWKETSTKEHTLNPVSFTFAHLAKTTPRFNTLLNANPFLRKSYEEQFIIGPNYTFVYNDQVETDRKNHLYFKGGIDLSGNLLHLVQSLFLKRAGTPDDPYTIFGTSYSQYTRLDIDFRHYFYTRGRGSTLASRVIAGAGFAYGNSSTMPYVKQFYAGGSNSVRAFGARSLGPGSYRTPDSLASNSFLDQTGDIRLEANMEYRFPIIDPVHGAVFADAGNIWLAREDPNRPGGKFSGKTFLSEMAVGTGLGIRVDLSFFVIRLDVAFPLRIPYLPEGQRWVTDKIDFGSPHWRKENLTYNIAIGYPY